MYQARVPLPKESVIEALQMLYGGDITEHHDEIVGGSINYKKLNYEKSGDMTVLKLEFIIDIEGELKLLGIETDIKKGSEDASGLYKVLEEIYQSMRARHGESITPLGIGPSGDIKIYYGGEDANGLGDTALKPLDISHICLN